MFIDKKSKSEFELVQASALTMIVNGKVSNIISKGLRKVLGKPFTRTIPSLKTVSKVTNSDYIKSVEPSSVVKFGYVFDKKDFIWVGLSREFIAQCAYLYAGGKADFSFDASLEGTPFNISESSFLKDFETAIFKEIEFLVLFDKDFDDLSDVEYIGADIQLDSTTSIFKDDVFFECDGATLAVSVVATKDAFEKVNSNALSNDSNVTLVSAARDKAVVEMAASFKIEGMDLEDIRSLSVGDALPLSLLPDGTPDSVLHTEDFTIEVSGLVGRGSANQYVFKLN